MSEFLYGATGLPAGLTLNALTGEVTGTPTTVGASPTTFTVTSNATGGTATLAWGGNVLDNPIVINGTCQDGTIGANYYAQLDVTGYINGAAHTSVSSGALPPGFALDTYGLGSVVGSATSFGTYNFSLVVTDSSTPTPRVSAPSAQTVVIADDPMTLTGTLADGTTSVAYSSTMVLGGYVAAPATVDASAGVIPGWMSVSVSGSTVTFSGTPTAAGTFNFTPRVTDSYTPTPRTAIGPAQSVVVRAPLVTWVSHTAPYSGGNVPGVGGGSIVVLHRGYAGSSTSTDSGATWTTSAQPASSTWLAQTYSGSTFVAVADGTTTYATSPDGAVWTARTLPAAMGGWVLGFLNGLFVLGASSLTTGGFANYLYTSSDGVTWTRQTLPLACGSFRGVTYGNGVFLATGNGRVITSPDGVTWTQVGTIGSAAVAFCAGLFVTAVGGNVFTSSDGATWTQSTVPAAPSGDAWTTVMATGNVVVVLSQASTGYIASSDGVNWSSYMLPPSLGNWRTAVGGNTMCLAANDVVLVGTT